MSDIQAHELPKREGVYDEVELENLAVAYDERLLLTRAEWEATIDYEAAIRQLVFDIIMHERNLSESDMDDQAEASEQVDEWMTLFAAVGEEEQ